jgi:hypothetical protein
MNDADVVGASDGVEETDVANATESVANAPTLPTCVNCGVSVDGPKVCGVRSPCLNCGYPYPVGDCSD